MQRNWSLSVFISVPYRCRTRKTSLVVCCFLLKTVICTLFTWYANLLATNRFVSNYSNLSFPLPERAPTFKPKYTWSADQKLKVVHRKARCQRTTLLTVLGMRNVYSVTRGNSTICKEERLVRIFIFFHWRGRRLGDRLASAVWWHHSSAGQSTMFSTTCDHGTLDVSRRRKDDALALQHLPEPVIRVRYLNACYNLWFYLLMISSWAANNPMAILGISW